MTPDIWLFLGAGLVGGLVNAAAGGAKLFVFPLLLATGLPPIAANATGTVAVWPAQLPAAWVYRRELVAHGRRLVRQMLPALAGALIGALLLIGSPEGTFLAIIPVLLLLAVTAILLGPKLADLMRRTFPGKRLETAAGVLLFFCGLYGGYFGAGLGFMLLAVLSAAGDDTLGRANAAKNLFAFGLNTVAVVPLALSGLVDWIAAAGVVAGGLAGGYLGAHITRHLPERLMRVGVAGLGLVLTLSFLFR
ncbi:sulfite exporter TauE/SafE family protein [Rhodovulum sp. YNF3179]|uniref:sulfite exporter TauE/SafE family protein n=1 Tax=Rhodovulum sp. YNF3179 TaxID=3425127 RepID=UPI003D331494